MRKIYIVLIFILFTARLEAQSTDSIPKLYLYIEHMASASYNVDYFLSDHIKYPPAAKDSNIEGRVKIEFVIDTFGHVDSVKVIKSAHSLLDSEAVRVIRLMPDWTPGSIWGIRTRMHITIPITFRLDNHAISREVPDSSEIKKQLAVKDSMIKNHGPELAILRKWESYMRYHLHYPIEAKKQHLTGLVRVRFLVEPSGEVSTYEIEDASLPEFNEAALRLSAKVAKMNWRPGLKNGVPARYYVVLPFMFGWPYVNP